VDRRPAPVNANRFDREPAELGDQVRYEDLEGVIGGQVIVQGPTLGAAGS
jgi:hypothetical protein